MDWGFLDAWISQMDLTPEDIYLACREYLLRKEVTDWRSEHTQMEFPFASN